ncbi:MAG: hypothetical protein KGK03_10315 [Candidatus Omnitrophica bacterium]|nr:hypothetical protein [Candidatus Omnitrophota bacterium]
MTVKTVRFNKSEEGMLKTILHHYHADFSSCIKELIMEKLEDLRDIGVIKRIKEGAPSDYLGADEITSLFKS